MQVGELIDLLKKIPHHAEILAYQMDSDAEPMYMTIDKVTNLDETPLIHIGAEVSKEDPT